MLHYSKIVKSYDLDDIRRESTIARRNPISIHEMSQKVVLDLLSGDTVPLVAKRVG